jgi:hypothetical protein
LQRGSTRNAHELRNLRTKCNDNDNDTDNDNDIDGEDGSDDKLRLSDLLSIPHVLATWHAVQPAFFVCNHSRSNHPCASPPTCGDIWTCRGSMLLSRDTRRA